jgi:hypothetical protein
MFLFLSWGVVSPPPNLQAGGPPLVGCPRLLIQYIHSYPPYLEAFSSIRNLRTCHAVVTRDPLNMEVFMKLDEIGARLELKSQKTLRCLAKETSILKSSATKVMKLFILWSYKVTVVHAL